MQPPIYSFMQPFIAAARLDLPSMISVVAFSLAIPLLAGLVMLNLVQSLHKYAAYPWYLVFARAVSQGSAFLVWLPRSGMSCGLRESWFRSAGSWG